MVDKSDDSRIGLLGRGLHIISSGPEGREWMARFMADHNLSRLGDVRDLDLVDLEIFVSEWEFLEFEESLGDPDYSATPPPVTAWEDAEQPDE